VLDTTRAIIDNTHGVVVPPVKVYGNSLVIRALVFTSYAKKLDPAPRVPNEIASD